MAPKRDANPLLTRPAAGLWLTVAGCALLYSLGIAVTAFRSGLGFITLPYNLLLIDQTLPWLFRLHMLASAAALVLLPLVIGLRYRADDRARRWHRRLGLVLAFFVVLGALTALPVALVSASSTAARLGFAAQGLTWLLLLAAGILAIRRRNYERHARYMIAMAAVTTGAVWFRLVTSLALLLEIPYGAAYAATAWLAWLIPLACALRWQPHFRLLGTSPRSPATEVPTV